MRISTPAQIVEWLVLLRQNDERPIPTYMRRDPLVQFAADSGLTIRLASYPPYHSKDNPVERCWGVLEQHWNGTLLDSLDAVLGFAASMTWKGARPSVALVTTAYERGVTLTKEAMAAVDAHLVRHPTLGKWF